MKVLSSLSSAVSGGLSGLANSALDLGLRAADLWFGEPPPPIPKPGFNDRVMDLLGAVEKMAFRSHHYAMSAWRKNQPTLEARRTQDETEFRETAELLVEWAKKFRESKECRLIWEAFGGDRQSEGPVFSIMGCFIMQAASEVPYESAVSPNLSVVCNPHSPTLFVYEESCDWVVVRPAVKLATAEDVYQELHPRFLRYAGRIVRRPGTPFIFHHLGVMLSEEASKLREQRDRIDRMWER